MKDTPEEVLKDTAQEHLDKTTTKNSLGAAIVAASLASTFVKEPPRRRFCANPLFDRAYSRYVKTEKEFKAEQDAQQEAIAKAKAKRERKAQVRTVSTNHKSKEL